jgi:hypothetical protein
MSEKVWGDAKFLHLSRLPVTDTGDDPMSPVCGMTGSKCLSGLYPTPIREYILTTSLVWCMHGDVSFSVGSAPHKMSLGKEIMGWLGVNNPKETDYYREILFPAFTEEAASMSVFDIMPVALPLPFNHGLTVGYAINRKITGAQLIEAWNVFTGVGENSHQWIDTPFFHRWAEVMALGEKRWPSAGDKKVLTTWNHQPAKVHGPCEPQPSPVTGSSGWMPWIRVSKAMKARRGTNSPS